ncbi:MAG TPA: hypothetical protein VHN79_01085 [Lacunisphaera sp.]|nr:hypothetical protein [Lacunisphaera sp.]
MIRWSIFCLLLGLLLASLGAAGISGLAIETGKLLLGALFVLAIVGLAMSVHQRKEDR